MNLQRCTDGARQEPRRSRSEYPGGMVMLRTAMIALMAMASVSILTVDAASARGGFGGGGFHGGGGGFHGGIGGGGFRSVAIGGGGFRSAAISGGAFRGGTFAANSFRGGFHPGFRHHRGFPFAAAAIGVGLGLGYPYGYYDDAYPYYADYGYDDSYYYGDDGCYIVRQSVWTPYGWRVRPVQECN